MSLQAEHMAHDLLCVCVSAYQLWVPIVQEHFLVDVDGLLVVCSEVVDGCKAQLQAEQRHGGVKRHGGVHRAA